MILPPRITLNRHLSKLLHLDTAKAEIPYDFTMKSVFQCIKILSSLWLSKYFTTVEILKSSDSKKQLEHMQSAEPFDINIDHLTLNVT